MTGEPWGTARIPLPPKSLSQFLLLPPLSSSSFPSLLWSCTLAHSLKVWGRGGALQRQLSCLPFYCFGEDLFVFFSQSFSFLPSLSSLTQPLPLLSILWLHVQQVLSTTEKTEIERRLRWNSCYFSFCSFLSAHLFCVAFIFDPLAWIWKAPSVDGLRLVRFFLSSPCWSPRLHPALQWSVSLHVCISRPSRMRIIAAAVATILRAVKCRW